MNISRMIHLVSMHQAIPSRKLFLQNSEWVVKSDRALAEVEDKKLVEENHGIAGKVFYYTTDNENTMKAAFVQQKNVRNLYIETRYIHLFFILICLFIMVQFVRGTGCSIRREIRDPIIYYR